MANVLLTNSTYIKSITNISDNVADKYLFPTINESQEIDLKNVIGERLLNKLKDMVQDQSINDPENEIYKELLTKSQFFLAYSVASKLAVILSYKIDNVGVYHTADENLAYASFGEVQHMEEYYQNKADFFKLEVVNFCLNNRSKLPELTDSQCHSIKSNLYSVESCGIVLGGERGKGRKKGCCYKR